MKPIKKENYYGTSVIRYLVSHVGKDTQRFNTTGDVYLNLRDIGKNQDFLLKVVAEEVVHIVEDTEDFKNEMYEFLRKEVENV